MKIEIDLEETSANVIYACETERDLSPMIVMQSLGTYHK